MSNSGKSIFTPRTHLARTSSSPHTSFRAPRTSSPFRRASTPVCIDLSPGRAAIAVVVDQHPAVRSALATDPPRRLPIPDTTSPSLADDSATHYHSSQSPSSKSIWASFVDNTASPAATSASAPRTRSVSLGHGATAHSPEAEPAFANFPLPQTPLTTESHRLKRKHALTPPSIAFFPDSEPSSKRVKLRPRIKHTLDSHSFGPSTFDHPLQPPSPLFFSNSPRPRPALPPRFSSSEAAARMLSKARTEESHVKTVSLARGTVTTPALGYNGFNGTSTSAHNRRSLERASTGRSSSPETASNGGREGASGVGGMLNSIGIIELLEQDERPTFIVNLGDSTNYGPGPLHFVFTNSSLKAHEGMQSLVSGLGVSGEATSEPNAFLQFKSWLLSAAVHGESLNVCLPPFSYAGVTWSCSTLRKRLRIISGAFITPPPASTAAMRLSIPPDETAPQYIPEKEPMDYFGPALDMKVNLASENSSAVTSAAMPTIEEIHSGPRHGVLEGASDVDHLTGMGTLSEPPTGARPSSTQLVTPDAFSSMSISTSRGSPPTYDSLSRSQPLDTPTVGPSFDWTRLPVSDSMPEHIRFARSIDWASTSLGPIEHWDADLRQMCNLIMASPHPAAMYWGPDLIAIYNEAYILLAGQKHPSLMGTSYRVAWAEIWDEVKDVFASAKITGEATMKDDDCLFIRRSNFLEETYFSWSIIPMVGSDGSVMGLYNPAFEKTRRKIAERRMLTLREVGERTASARDVKGFWTQVLGSFEFNEYDSPFMLLYSVADEGDSDASSIQSGSVLTSRQCFLEGSLGIPQGHQAAPDQIDVKSGMEGFGPIFREVMKTDKPVLIEVGSRDLPASLLDGLELRGFGDPVKAIVVCPIHPTTGESVLGFLVLGVNPRRPYDDDYGLFVQLLSRQLATSLASVVLFEEEIRRGQKAAQLAALDRIELSEKLAARTAEAIESETKFTRMAEFAPVGIVIADRAGKITFANDTWYDISRVPKNADMADTWMEAVKPEDMLLVKKAWSDLVEETKAASIEFRFKAQRHDRSGNRGDTWVLFSGFPEKYGDGRLKSIFGSMTDISQQKWAEGLQTRKMEEAVELKRQQENFIDITSHEMRNPLSAILQCSDEIITSMTKMRQGVDGLIQDELLASCLDAAQTISLCSQHQKRIVDDILTLSKLDSQLLLVTPVDAQPLTVVKRALKMHEGELQAADIQMKFTVDQSFRDLGLDWVRFDPSRVLQVLINLTTNAIKFTGTENKRTITVTIAASLQRPSDKASALVKYFPTRRKDKDTMAEKDWGDGEKLYIHFSVRDTGRGLSAQEKKLLFIRFSQASPRTHVQYGGSGLGLFISRELTELQGGEIGVESEAGKGSIFAFYVAARRTTPPQDAVDDAAGFARHNPPSSNNASETSARDKQEHTAVTDNPKPKVMKVLIVEDNLVNQRVLQKQLKNVGTEVHLANHGGEALERLMQSTYWRGGNNNGPRLELGVVLMDQEMPVMDGLTCTRKIRELEAEGKLTGHVPIIAVTANARAEQVQTALDAGMDDVVSKPFRIPELIPKIEDLMMRYPTPRA